VFFRSLSEAKQMSRLVLPFATAVHSERGGSEVEIFSQITRKILDSTALT
jgi:hypothetical protein